jgi:hypothetical protein
MSMPRRKRCPFCRCLFWPDPRTRWRQWACSKPECQAKRKVESNRRYRVKNPSDSSGKLYREQVSAMKNGKEVPGVPPKRGPLASLPWDEMEDEIPPEVLVMLVFFGRLLLRATKDERRSEPTGITGESRRLLTSDGKTRRPGGGPAP